MTTKKPKPLSPEEAGRRLAEQHRAERGPLEEWQIEAAARILAGVADERESGGGVAEVRRSDGT